MDPKQLHSELEQLIDTLECGNVPDFERLWNKHDLEYLLRWFDPKALSEIAMIRTVISQVKTPEIKAMAEIVLSNILRPISWQKNSSLRTQKEVTIYVEGDALQAFIEQIRCQQKKMCLYLSLIQNAQQLPDHEVIAGDTRSLDSLLPTYVGACDMLITSPPYATALPYIDTDRLSLIVLGLLPRKDHRGCESQLIGNREVSEGQRRKHWETYQTRKDELPNAVCELIDILARANHGTDVGFRRRNLPALLAKYFFDMTDVFYSAHQMM